MSESLLFPLLKEYLEKDQAVTLATVVRGPLELLGGKAIIPLDGNPHGPLLDLPWGQLLVQDAGRQMRDRESGTHTYADGEVEIFFDVHTPSLRLIIVGAVHIADPLIQYAKPLGYRTCLVDPRTAFATEDRFPHVDELHHQWPDEALPQMNLNNETAVVVITHDPKLDDPALKIALTSPAFYVGALGSPKTHNQRIERLLADGLTKEQLARLHAPIGLNIGGRTPAEIALAIITEIVAVRNKSPLVSSSSPNISAS